MPDETILPSRTTGPSGIGLAWGLLGVAIWSGSFVLTRLGVKTTLNPYDIIALRFGFGGIVLLPVIWRQGFAIHRLGGTGLVLLVAGSGAPYALLSAIGLQFAPASQAAALIPGFMTGIVAVLGSVLLGERLSPQAWASVALIVVGCLLISGMSANHEETTGHVIFFFAAVLWAGYVIVLKRAGLSALHATAIAAVASAIGYLPVYASLLPHGIATAPVRDIALQAIYQGGFTTVLGLVAFNQAVRRLGAAAGSALSALIPVVTLLIAAMILDETPGFSDIAAACAIALGVAFLATAKKASLPVRRGT